MYSSNISIEQFFEYCRQGKFMAVECKDCGKIFLPPKSICPYCSSRNLTWKAIKPIGKIITYTKIYVKPRNFFEEAPYIVGIAEFEGGVRLPGIVKNVDLNSLRIGLQVRIVFLKMKKEECSLKPLYYFKPIETDEKLFYK